MSTATPQPTASPTPSPTPTVAAPTATPTAPSAIPATAGEKLLVAVRLGATGAQTKAPKRQFPKEITLSVYYGAVADQHPRLSLAWWNEATRGWERLPSSQDTARQVVSARISHFSVFGVLVDPPLHAADVVLAGNTYNTINNNPQAGLLDTVNTVITTRRADLPLKDAANIGIFASDPVPTGKIWDIGGTWTFDTYVRVTAGASGSRFFVKAKVYKVGTDGVAAALTGVLPSARVTLNTTYQLVSWTGVVPATTLFAGERYGAEFYAWSDDAAFPSDTFYLGYDTTAQPSGVTPSLVESNAPGAVKQNHYRIGKDTALTAMQWYAVTDAEASDLPRSTNFRVRFQVYNDGTSVKNWRPRLEYSSSQTTGYAAVPTTSGAAPFFVADTAQFTNGAAINTVDFALGTGPGTAAAGVAYDTVNPPASAITLTNGTFTEIEFNMQANANAAWDATYYFRLTDNGTALDSYLKYADITMKSAPGTYQAHSRIGYDQPLSSVTWYASADARGLVERNRNFRVRFQVYNDSGATLTWSPRLDWSAASPVIWAAVPTASGAAPFFVSDTTQFANGAVIATATFALGTGLGTAADGVAYDTQNPGASMGLFNTTYTEIEFSVQANNNAVISGNYLFRLTNSGTALTGYKVYGDIVMQEPPPPTPTPGPPAHNNHQPYGADTDACAACHRAHTAKGRQALEKRAWPESETCFTCHDGTGAAPNIKAQFNKTYTMPLTTTGSLHSLVEVRTKDPALFSGANRHVACTDCHNPHYASQGQRVPGPGGNYAPGANQGIWGVSAIYTTPWAPPTFATVGRITYVYELCFKCHSSWAYGGSPPTSPSGGYPQTDQSKEFNPLNASYMPVVAQGKNPFIYEAGPNVGQSYAGSLRNGNGGVTNPLTPTSRIACTDCHASETQGDPAGAHGSTNPFILRRPWGRTTGGNPASSNGGPDTSNHLCFLCHDYQMYTNDANTQNYNQTGYSGTRPNLHALHVGKGRNKLNNDQPIVCLDCHIAIPHGYFRENLIGFTGDGPPYVNRPGGLTTINTWAPSGNWKFSNCATAMNACR